jgi:hypothetical protein
MSRTIKFRGLRRDGLGWAYGYLCPDKDGDMNIITEQPWEPIFRFKVHHGSIGQFTGLTDRNGVGIFIGDVVTWLDGNNQRIAKVVDLIGQVGFEIMPDSPTLNEGYVFEWGIFYYKDTTKYLTVIRNIHEQ